MEKSRLGKKTFSILFTTCWILFICPENSSPQHMSRIKNTVFQRQGSLETATILTEGFVRTTHFILHDPERIVVDFHGAVIPEVGNVKNVSGSIISSIRTHQNQKNIVRVVVDIRENTPYFFELSEDDIDDSPKIRVVVSPPRSIEPVISLSTGHETVSVSLDNLIPDDIFEETNAENQSPVFSISGLLQGRTSFQTNKHDAVENNMTFRNRIILEGKYKNELTMSALSDYLYFGNENENDDYDISLHEAKWERSGKKYEVSIGKQIIRWGKTDQFSPIDTLNPEDLRELILPDYEERKIPVWMADAKLFSKYFTFEGAYIPFHEKSKIDYFDTNWSVFGHMKKELTSSLLSPSLKTYVQNLAVHETDPEDEAEFAFRLQTTFKKIDLGLTFHRMIEDVPYFKSFPIKNIQFAGDLSSDNLTSLLDSAILTNEAIEVEYKKTKAVGLEFETTLADFGLRGETVWKENESFLTSTLTSVRRPTLTYIIGADYTTAENTYFNFQFLHSHIRDYSDSTLYFDRDTIAFLGLARTDLISDWLQGAVKYNIGINNNCGYVSPYLRYTYITNLECIAGASIFYGDPNTWFGRFKNYDFVYLDVAYRF